MKDKADAESILQALNQEPEYFLQHFGSVIRAEITVGERKYKLARDGIKGGIVAFVSAGIAHFIWDKNSKKWIFG